MHQLDSVRVALGIEMVSVVIPSRGRAHLLQRTLDSVGGARGAVDLDVVVIDDGSDPPLDVRTDHLPVEIRVDRQEAAGLNAARMRGVKLTSRPVVAFLDDDVRVDPEWPAGVAAAFADGQLAVMAGRVVGDPELPVPKWVHPQKLMYLSVLDLGPTRTAIPGWASPVGANLAMTRAALEDAGGFRPGLDRDGSSLLSGGDTELVQRIVAAGGTVAYWPAATVFHHVAKQRLTKSWFRRRAMAQGFTDIHTRFERRPGIVTLAIEALRPARAAGILVKRLTGRQSVFDAELWLWSCVGRWRALKGLPRCATASNSFLDAYPIQR